MLHARTCALITVGVMVGVAVDIPWQQGYDFAKEVRETTGSLGEFATATEIAVHVHDSMEE